MPDEFEGYRADDLTYCVIPDTSYLFPVRVVRIYRDSLTVTALDEDLCAQTAPEFAASGANRRFYRPRLPASARFGGYDERLVNTKRESGAELRILPTHYNTTTNSLIRERHAAEPERWPLPTGVLHERWFQERR